MYQNFKKDFIDYLAKIDDSALNYWKDKIDTLNECGSYVRINTSGTVVRANFCRSRFCPLCQKRRSLKVYSRMLSIIEQMFDNEKYSFLHIVLTVPNCTVDTLNKVVTNLFNASRKLFKDKRLIAFKGVVRFFECTINAETRTYHPHLHCIVAVKKSYFTSRYYVSAELLRRVWAEYSAQTYSQEKKIPQVDISAKGETPSLIAEVSKYCVKPIDFNGDLHSFKMLLHLYDILKGRRLIQFFGVFREYSHILNNDNDIDEQDINLAFKEFVFNHHSYTELI